MLVKPFSFISTKFQVSGSPRMVPEAGLMKPCPQEHMRPIGSISPGAIAHDRLGSARRVTNSQLVCVSGGFQAAQGRNECATSTNTANRASLEGERVLFPTQPLLRNLEAAERDSQVDEVMKMAVEGSHVSDRSGRPPGRFATFDGASEPQ